MIAYATDGVKGVFGQFPSKITDYTGVTATLSTVNSVEEDGIKTGWRPPV
jgi:hypothetical protein